MAASGVKVASKGSAPGETTTRGSTPTPEAVRVGAGD
jgi:hypothetical protein